MAGLAFDPEHLALNHRHEIGFKFAAIKIGALWQGAFDILQHLIIGCVARALELAHQHPGDINLKPAASQELSGRAVFRRDDPQLFAR